MPYRNFVLLRINDAVKVKFRQKGMEIRPYGRNSKIEQGAFCAPFTLNYLFPLRIADPFGPVPSQIPVRAALAPFLP